MDTNLCGTRSIKNFSPDLLELCNNILKLPIQKRELRTGNFIQGLRLRSDGVDDDIPRYDGQLERAVEANKATIGGDSCGGSVGDRVEAGTPTVQDCGGCGGLNQLFEEEKEINLIKEQKAENIEYVEEEQGAVSSTLPTSFIEQGIDLPQSAPIHSPLDTPQQAVDFSTFPHLTSNDYRAKENLALKIKLAMLACGTCEALAQFQTESGYGESAIAWVIEKALSEAEKSDLEGIRSISQPSLDLSMLPSAAPVAPVINQVVPSVESVSGEVVEDSTYHWDEIERETDVCLGQLGWTLEQGRAYLQSRYGVASRRRLSDEQLLEFLAYLKGEVARSNL